MAKPLELRLSVETGWELQRMRDTHPLPYVCERAGALLKVAAGHSGREVALQMGIRPRQEDTVYTWVHRYQLAGVAGLLIKPGRGRKPAFSPSAGHGRRGARSAVAHGA